MFVCLECGKRFRTVKAAERASYHGCPKCGGTDIDIDAHNDATTRNQRSDHRPAPTRKDNDHARRS